MKVRNGTRSIALDGGRGSARATLSGLSVVLTLLAAACGDSPTQLMTDRVPAPDASVNTPTPSASVTVLNEPFDAWNDAQWQKGEHYLGLSYLDPANVTVSGGQLVLATPAGGFNGGEIYSTTRYQYGIYSARMKCNTPGGTVCAFFLYQAVPGNKNDEIDIEVLPGTNEIMLTTWVQGRSTNHVRFTATQSLSDYHTYTIEYRANAVTFSMDGTALKRFTRKLPTRAMGLFANTWWPTWLSGSPTGGTMSIDWIQAAS